MACWPGCASGPDIGKPLKSLVSRLRGNDEERIGEPVDRIVSAASRVTGRSRRALESLRSASRHLQSAK
jgi:hypothetical protein